MAAIVIDAFIIVINSTRNIVIDCLDLLIIRASGKLYISYDLLHLNGYVILLLKRIRIYAGECKSTV